MLKRLIGLLAVVAVCAIPTNTYPDEKMFTYSYEAKVLPKGGLEMENWATFNIGQVQRYEQLQARTEIEYGFSDRLCGSLYFNWEHTKDIGAGVETTLSDGFSTEWKYKVSDPTVNAIGFLLYIEPAYGPLESELEEKLVFSKNLGRWTLAYNFTFSPHWFKDADIKNAIEIQNTGGISYRINKNWAVGLEANQDSFYHQGVNQATGIFAGPNIHYATEKWWATLTFMPQISGSPATTGGRNLTDFTKAEVRLIFSIEF